MGLITTVRRRPFMREASALALLLVVGALAVTPAAAQEAVQPSAGGSVTPYPSSFFAAQRPGTAMDMVNRLPGFAFDDGANVRGFAGAAANVLINGRRPSSKTDDVGAILSRLPAGQVERIDVIRGGAPGIDMQGKAVIANVVLKSGSGFTGVVAVASTFSEDGRIFPDYRLEGTWQAGDTRIEAGQNGTHIGDDTAGSGPHLIRDGSGAIVDRSQMQNRSATWQQTGTAAWETPLIGGRLRINAMAQDQAVISTYTNDFLRAGRRGGGGARGGGGGGRGRRGGRARGAATGE